MTPHNILFSYCQAGNGHRVQAQTIASELADRGHEISWVNPPSLKVVVKDGVLDPEKTILPPLTPLDEKILSEYIEKIKPSLVVSDFDPYLPMVAKSRGIPTVVISSQHSFCYALHRMPLEFVMLPVVTKYDKLLEMVAKYADHLLIPSFIRPSVLETRALPGNFHVMRGPIIRRELEAGSYARPTLMLYVDYESKYYDGQKYSIDPNFAVYLINCDKVFCNGSHGIVSEALFLGKPLVCNPIINHVEQIINSKFAAEWKKGDKIVNARDEVVDYIERLLNK